MILYSSVSESTTTSPTTRSKEEKGAGKENETENRDKFLIKTFPQVTVKETRLIKTFPQVAVKET